MSSIQRVGDSGDQAGQVGVVNLVKVNTGHFITPVSTSEDKLKLISWHLDPNAGPTRVGDSGDQAGEITRCASVAVGNNRLVTAVQSKGTGRLKLISWQVSTDGTQIQRVADSGDLAGEVDRLDLHRLAASETAQPPIDLVTTVRSSTSKRLKLIGWRLFHTGGFTRVGDSGSQAGEVTQLAGQPGVASNFFATAERATDSGDLKLIGWRIEPQGAGLSFTRLGDSGSAAGAVSQVALTRGNLDVVAPSNTYFSSVRAADGRLKIIAWRVDEAEGTFDRVADTGTLAGDVEALWAEYQPFLGVATAVRASGGDRLRMIWWDISGNHPESSSNPLEFERRADSGDQAGAISSVTGLVTKLGGNGPRVVLAAVRTKEDGRLKLINWHFDFS